MDKKKLIIMIGGGLLVLVAIILIISLITPSPQPSTNSGGIISSVVLAKGEDKNKNPLDVTNIFSTNDPEIHAIIIFNSLPANQTVTYQWFDIKNNKALKEEKRQNTAVFSGLSTSSLVKDDKLTWSVGNYEFRILINDVLTTRNPYSVKTDADIEKDKVLSSIQGIELTTAVDVLGKPTRNTSTVFSKDDEDIFASVSYIGMPVKSEFEGRWTYLDEDRLIKRYQKSIVGSDTFAFSINAKTDSWLPIKKWPVGRYILRIYLNGEQIKELPFTVE